MRVVLFALVLLPAGLLAWALAQDDSGPDAVRSGAPPVVVAAEARTILDEKPALSTVELREGASLLAPAWQGTVLASLVAPGTVLTTGAGVANVDGVVRMAAHTELPFYRTLASDDTGADVAALNGLLVRLGHLAALPDPPDWYSFNTAQAVRALERGLGVASPSGVFDPAWVVWLPFEPFTVGETALVAAAPAPAAGSAIAKEAPRLLRAPLTAANPQDALALDPAVAWVFVAGKQRFAVKPDTVEVDPMALPALQQLLAPKQERVDGSVQRATPLEVVAVPSTAVQVGEGGGLCAWLPDGKGYRAVPVTVAGARAGVTNVRSGVRAGEQVLSNPADVLEDPACPSP